VWSPAAFTGQQFGAHLGMLAQLRGSNSFASPKLRKVITEGEKMTTAEGGECYAACNFAEPMISVEFKETRCDDWLRVCRFIALTMLPSCQLVQRA
jgi:hypothetical protein